MVIRGFRDDSVSNESNSLSLGNEGLAKGSLGGSSLARSARRGGDGAKKSAARKLFRQSLLETLEGRNLLAAGPQLIGIQPNNSELIENAVIRDVAPRELTFRFDQSQIIDPTTTGGIRLTRSGNDGTFALNSVSTDFGTAGKVDIQLTMKSSGQTLSVNTVKSDLGSSSQTPLLSLAGNTLTITLNSNGITPTTAGQLVNAINSSAALQGVVGASINGGFANAPLGSLSPTTFGPVLVNQTNDQVITPASTVVGTGSNQNEVTLRFGETLVDDAYRIEVFGFDNQASGIVGLRNVVTGQAKGDLFKPTISGTNQDTVLFRLDLGSKVLGVVPQPVVRNTNDSISQLRNQIVVYFDNDKLLVENDSSGKPTARSAENTDFYQLIYTVDTVRNTDDVTYKPVKATYNATANTVTLEFDKDINDLRPANAPNAAYRLRIGTRESLPIAPIQSEVAELGNTFTTAKEIGTLGSLVTPLSSFVFTSEIKNSSLGLDNLGSSDDPGHRDLGDSSFDNHVNSNFGADSNPGITKINYNFRSAYTPGTTNTITDLQQTLVRDALQMWSRYLGVQFVETPDLGLTFATGSVDVLNVASADVFPKDNAANANEPTDFLDFRARIDPTFNNGLLIMKSSRQWNERYGEDYYRHAITGIGMLLGLTYSGDLPASTLLALNKDFLDGNGSVSNIESVFPGAQDILHGQFIHKADDSDIDLYRFEVNFGSNNPNRVGEFVAETFSERGEQASSLDTNLKLYRETQATALSNFGSNKGVGFQFTAVQPGNLGNHLQILVSRSPFDSSTPGFSNNTIVKAFPNLITVELNSTSGSETTVAQLLKELQTNPLVQAQVKVVITPETLANVNERIGANEVSYSPIELLGGGMEVVAQNDNYFSEDSLMKLSLGSGVYYIGVSAAGNNSYDPSIVDSGTGGRTEGRYDLRVTFRSQTDAQDSIQDTATRFVGDTPKSIDGDADGTPGGVYDFWFETRPLERIVSVNAGGSASLEGQVISITGANGVVRRLEFSVDSAVGTGNTRIPYAINSTSTIIASNLNSTINSLSSQTGVTSTLVAGSTTSFKLTGERVFSVPSTLPILDVAGKTIFVDKLAGPNADGSLAKPFNNIQNPSVANAFGSALPGDIVRIVGNGGNDRNLATPNDNFAYEFGYGLIGNATLTDGAALEVPHDVIAMIDAGAIFKSRRSRIAVGSSNAGIDRSGANIQVLGTPSLVENNTTLKTSTGQVASGSVYFTSWLDETIGRDSYGPTTVASNGDWGGIVLQRDVDRAAARSDLEDEGIFLNYINFADIRYGGGGGVVIDSVQQVVNPIQIIDSRPTITYNSITRSSDAAMSAAPNSFVESLFTDKTYQVRGAFTPDYDRVGPSIHDNRLLNNSLNGLFIRVVTLAGESPKNVTVAGRFDDIDITHILTENILLEGTPGGNILDYTRPETGLLSTSPLTGGTLSPGVYNYKVTFVDQFGNESVPSAPSADISLTAGQTAVSVDGVPAVQGDYKNVRLYRSKSGGLGPYDLVAQLDVSATAFLDRGKVLGGTLQRDQLDLSGLSSTESVGGNLSLGSYLYKIVMIDAVGREGLASDASTTQILSTAGNGTLTLANLPITFGKYTGRRIYRSDAASGGTYRLIAELPNSTSASITNFTDNVASPTGLTPTGKALRSALSPESQGVLRSRLDASLVIDPGATLKIEGARIELGQGTQLLSEGTENLPIVITSKLDDSSGAGGTFDTNNDGTTAKPGQGNWGGIFAAPGSKISLDHTTIAYAGGVTRIEGTFRSFNALEIQQADARIANSTFQFNANGVGGQGPDTRFGRMANEPATVLIRGASPIFVNNIFKGNTSGETNSVSPNRSAAISIDANSMTNVQQGDVGRMTGEIDRITTLDTNRGPLFRGNIFSNNDLNGLKIRGDNRSRNIASPIGDAQVTDISNLASDALTVESVWDDTDIVHVLYDGIFVENLEHVGGLSLESTATESLVVKLIGGGSNFDPLRGSGFTAGGRKSSITDRVGGTIHVIGQPGFPVILTSLRDDTAGAGLNLSGSPQLDTNNDGIDTIPRPGDWRGILLDQNSNDRNVGVVLEQEPVTTVAPGINGTTLSAQVLGQLAASATNSDENFRLGFVVKGILSQPEDVDVYSFTATAGSEVWLDVDNTSFTLDTVIELLDANGNLLARSDNSTNETTDPSLLLKTSGIAAQRVNPLNKLDTGDIRVNANGTLKEDGTTNARDAGMRVILPGPNGSRSGYFFRIRSHSINPDNVNGGVTAGSYQVQVRLREAQEFPGSVVTGADIRYATNGVLLRGLPAHSPLLGEAKEDESVRPANPNTPQVDDSQTFANNDIPWSYWPRVYSGISVIGGIVGSVNSSTPESNGVRPQYVGNVLGSDQAALSIAGNLSNQNDVDFYRFSLSEKDVINGTANLSNLAFDIDYADGLNKPDTSLSVYQLGGTPGHETWRLVYVGDGSNIAEDQRLPLSGTSAQELSRGSFGTSDPFIDTGALSAGDYLVAVHSATRVPSEFSGNGSEVILARLASINVNTGSSIPLNLSTVTATDNPQVTFVQTALPAAGTYIVTVSSVSAGLVRTFPIVGSTFSTFQAIPLTAFAGLGDVIVRFPVLATNGGGGGGGGNNTAIKIEDVRVVSAEQAARRIPMSQISTAAKATIDFAAPQAARTVSFDLRGYVSADLPAAYFDYRLFAANDFSVTVTSSRGTQTNTFVTPLDASGRLRQAKIDLGFHAGAADVKVTFTRNNPGSASTVSNVIVGFAERGEQVIAGVRQQDAFMSLTTSPLFVTSTFFYAQQQTFYVDQLFTQQTAPSTSTLAGNYQLEIRRIQAPSITNTNDRDSIGISLVVPDGTTISDGQVFKITDGANNVEFEFNITGGVGVGRVPITVAVGDSAAVIATRIRDAINNPGVQSRFSIRAAGADGLVTGALTGNRVNLFGNASVEGFFSVLNSNVLEFGGEGDNNVPREQGQIIISGNFIRHSRDYGVWSEAGTAEYDPRDTVDTYSLAGNLIENGSNFNENAIIQARPPLVGSSPGPARNLQSDNNSLVGGFTTGIVVENNVLEHGGLGGVQIAGENPIWMITPLNIPSTDNTYLNAAGSHAGYSVFDGDLFWFTSGRTRVGYEFEDTAGAGRGLPDAGSGVVNGNGWNADHVPVYYREDNGGANLRDGVAPFPTAWGYSALELMHSFRDSVNGSILVTNGTTQVVKATIAMSLLDASPIIVPTTAPTAPTNVRFIQNLPVDNYLEATPGINFANRPSLYLEGVSGVYFQSSREFNVLRNPWDIRRVDKADGVQPFARIVNNTIIGNDGTASFNPDTSVNESNDTISTAVQTQQGTGHTPLGFTMNAAIGDNPTLRDATTDVDFYQFKLDIGDRVQVDIDTITAGGVDTSLQLFDANGRPVAIRQSNGTLTTVVDQDVAPGEPVVTTNVDPFLDYTAVSPGVYYVAVTAKGNIGFDPQSLVARTPGIGTGAYTIGLSVLHPQNFTITVEDPANYQSGETFQIAQIADIQGTTSNVRTFEFTRGAAASVAAGNIPVFIGPNYRIPDVARSIAKAIRASGLTNAQQLANGIDPVTGATLTASPLDPVTAFALGGQDGVLPTDGGTGELGGFGGINPGLRLFPLREDGFFVEPARLSWYGFGTNRLGTNGSEVFGDGPTQADGLGTTERFVVIQNAAWIRSNGNIRVDPDFNDNSNLDQLLPETGIMVAAGASPTILNNVFYNVQTPIVNEESRTTYIASNPITYGDIAFLPAPFGSGNRDASFKPGQVIVGGSVYQFADGGLARNRQLLVNADNPIGIETGPTNVPNTNSDFNFTATATDQLFVNAQAGQFLPARGSRLIDSSIDSLTERSAFNTIKQTAGLSPSPVLAPSIDAVGQLRVDDPEVSPPQGLGANIFKDRGALDRSDFVGPTAKLLFPIDNDSQANDKDPAVSVVQLKDGTYPEFKIQLSDSLSASDPFPGVGVDDNTVVGPNDPPTRLPGAMLTISEDGRTLTEQVDYVFSYNPTTKEIVLTPLAGVWRNDRVYEITLNNRDRFVIQSPSGDAINDGDQFSVVDSLGGVVTFEYDSGYRIQLPQGLTLKIPSVGAGPGGIADGALFSLAVPGSSIVNYELDSNGTFDPANRQIAFLSTDSAITLAGKILAAIKLGNTQVSAKILPSGDIFIGAPTGSLLTATNSTFSQPSSTLGIAVPIQGAQVGGVTDGQFFKISDGSIEVTFEIDSNSSVTNGRIAVNTSNAFSANDVAIAIQKAISGTALAISPVLSSSVLYLGLSDAGSVTTTGSNLTASGFSRTVLDGDSVTVTSGAISKTFEFENASLSPGLITVGATPVPFDLGTTPDELGNILTASIKNAGLGLQPKHLGGGNIAVGGTTANTIKTSLNTTVGVFGQPGVTNSTAFTINGTLVLKMPSGGGSSIPDNRIFTITNNGTTATFEFDRNGSGPTTPTNRTITFAATDTAATLAGLVSVAINGTPGLGIVSRTFGDQVNLGRIATSSVAPGLTGITTSRGGPVDGESFSISDGTQTVVFEFENTTINNGITANRRSIPYTDVSTPAQIAALMATALNSAGLNFVKISEVKTNADSGSFYVQLYDTPRFTYVISAAPSLSQTGLAGGANRVSFIRDASFSSDNVRAAIVAAVNQASNTSLTASVRAGSTLFIDNAVSVSANTSGYFLRGIQDLAKNNLQPTRQNGETQFTILMPGTVMDFGNAPDPYTTAQGRYPTLFTSNGARHVVVGDDEVQLVGWNAGTTLGGTFKLTQDGLTTAAIPANATAAQVRTALESLASIGAGNVQVDTLPQLSGSSNVRHRITFIGTRTSLNVSPLAIDISSLTGSSVITPIQTTETEGVSALRLGKYVSGETDATITSVGDGDKGDDGVTFVSNTIPVAGFSGPIFNRNIVTYVTVTASAPGFLSAWFDFNSDGDWEDPNEQIDFNNPEGITSSGLPTSFSVEFTADSLTKTIGLKLPPTAPLPTTAAASAFARFRLSSAPVLLPTGLASDGEVEDYPITIVGGTPPVATNVSYSLREDIVGGLQVSDSLGNSTPSISTDDGLLTKVIDADGTGRTGFTVKLIDPPLHADSASQFNLKGDGTFTYKPAPNYFGTDSFTYEVFDGVLGSLSIGTVSLTIDPVNDAPTVPNKTATIFKNQSYTITAAALLNDGNSAGPVNEISQSISLGTVAASTTAGGSVSLVAGSYVYQPPVNFVGIDRFTYVVSDNAVPALSTTGTVVITVTDRNTPPVAAADQFTIDEDPILAAGPPVVRGSSKPFSFFTQNDLPSDGLDPNEVGQTVSLTAVNPTSAANGTVVIQGSNVIYTPPLNFNGIDTFTYTITDSGTPSASSTGTVTVTVRPVNDAPVKSRELGTITAAEDSTITPVVLSTYFTDPDIVLNNDVLTYSIVSNSNPALVTPAISSTGQLLLPLGADQNGSATIVIRATDSSQLSVTNTLTLVVTPVTDSAKVVAQIPPQNANEDLSPSDIALAPNYFVNPDNLASPANGLTFTASSSNTALVSTSIVNGALRLTLLPNANGAATITVRANNGNGEVSQTFTLNVNSANDAPTTTVDSYNVPANYILKASDPTGSVTATSTDNGVLANDFDVEANTFTAQLVRQPVRGIVTFNPNGTFTYLPNDGSVVGQTDSFTYIATDSQGAASSETLVTINYSAPIVSPHRNPNTQWQFLVGTNISSPDVNNDASVTALDALIIINYLNDRTSVRRVPLMNFSPPPFRDVNGDMSITALDILQVINYLNARSRSGNGEGESAIASTSSTIVAMAPIVSSLSSGGSNLLVDSNTLIPMQDVVISSSRAATDSAMAAIVQDASSTDSEFGLDELVSNSSVSSSQTNSAFDLALVDLFDSLSKKRNAK